MFFGPKVLTLSRYIFAIRRASEKIMKTSTLFLLLLGVGCAFSDELCDVIEPAERLDCGYYGIGQEECETDRGCCYDDTVEDVPYCFRNEEHIADSCFSIDAEERAECGWIGIDKDTCETRDCCYDNNHYGFDSKHCFYPKGNKCYGIQPQDREDCGYYGIERDECEKDRGCCFDHTVQGVPWCFIGKYEPTPPSTEEPMEPETANPTEGEQETEAPTTPGEEESSGVEV